LINERIEWIEPEEATRERHEKSHRELREMCDFFLRWGLILGIPAALLLAFLDIERGQLLTTMGCILAVPIICPMVYGLEMRLDPEPHKQKYVLKAEDARFWKHVRSFRITDHPTLPGIRCLTTHYKGLSQSTQFNFRTGQLNEAELSTFIEARIAEQRAQRLMRRVKM